MDFKQIQELIKIINKSNIGELNIEDKDFKINIKQKEEPAQNVIAAPQSAPIAYYTGPQPVAPATASQEYQPNTVAETVVAKPDNTITIKSPMIGTFYRRPSPDKPIFAEIGDEVVPGSIVCIIEAMKLFNEIESEVSGKIVKILVEDASPVEYDQPLFLVEPA